METSWGDRAGLAPDHLWTLTGQLPRQDPSRKRHVSPNAERTATHAPNFSPAIPPPTETADDREDSLRHRQPSSASFTTRSSMHATPSPQLTLPPSPLPTRADIPQRIASKRRLTPTKRAHPERRRLYTQAIGAVTEARRRDQRPRHPEGHRPSIVQQTCSQPAALQTEARNHPHSIRPPPYAPSPHLRAAPS